MYANTNQYPTIHASPSNSIAPALHVIGIGMMLVGMVTAIYLYQSFAVTIFEKIIYGLFGFFFSLLSGILPVASHHLKQAGYGSLSIVAWLIWLSVCFTIGTQTHLGFMSYSQAHFEQETAKNSLASQVAKNDLEQANSKLDQLTQYAGLDIEVLTAKRTALESELGALNTSLSACPTNYFKKCIDPLNAQITAKQNELQPVIASINSYQQYNGAMTAKQQALTAMQSAGVVTDSDSLVHPLFVTQSRLVSFSPSLMQSLFLAFSAVAYEVLTALVLLFASKLSTRPVHYAMGYQVNTQPHNHHSHLPSADNQQLTNEGNHHADDDNRPRLADEKKSELNNAPVHNAMSDAMNNASVNNAPVHNASDKKTVGATYQCVQCGGDYQARTVWQKYCPECGTAKRDKFKRAKG